METSNIDTKLDRNGVYLLVMLCYVSVLNSATQGYDSAMMNGLQILPSYTEYFALTTATTSLNVAVVFLGSVVATPFAGTLADKWGRKWGMAVTAAIALLGAAIQSAAIHEAMFCIGRFIVGIFITTGSTAAPAYISETAHPKYRVLLTGLCGAAWYVGGVMAAAVTFGTQYLSTTWSWRAPSLLQFLPSMLCLVVLPFIPESPRWLVYNDRLEEAKQVLVKYHANGDVGAEVLRVELNEIVQTLEYEKSVQKAGFKALIATRPNRWRFGIVAAVSKRDGFVSMLIYCFLVFCQISGNNIITYYLGTVLTTIGITGVQTQLAINLGLSVFNLLCAIAGSSVCEKIGRRPSFRKSFLSLSLTFFLFSQIESLNTNIQNKTVISTSIMALLLIIVSALTKQFSTTPTTASSSAQVALIFLFYGAYSLVWTPLAYLYPLEVLSFSLRASGMASYNGLCYTAAFFNTYIIPYAMGWSSWGFYLITAGWCFVEVGVMWVYFPETKGMTLEEVDVVFDGVRHVDLDVDVDVEMKGVEVVEGEEVVVEVVGKDGDGGKVKQ
ncbi:MFS general substrate transporter [Aureobasidium pullulans]|uniref:MFS general substrate transporter n=1 Tax=Aureobasidium pullulans TaxID=5580 RepID=A0A4S9SZI6_AURPU|nr:MFS general substrate transporter [Aureobasidium pullulans]